MRTFKGHEVRVPPLGMGTKVSAPARAASAVTPPEGRPDRSWIVKDLELWAEALGFEFESGANKGDKVFHAQAVFDDLGADAPEDSEVEAEVEAEDTEDTEEF